MILKILKNGIKIEGQKSTKHNQRSKKYGSKQEAQVLVENENKS